EATERDCVIDVPADRQTEGAGLFSGQCLPIERLGVPGPAAGKNVERLCAIDFRAPGDKNNSAADSLPIGGRTETAAAVAPIGPARIGLGIIAAPRPGLTSITIR